MLAYLRAYYSLSYNTVAEITRGMGRVGLYRSQVTVRNAVYSLERVGLAERESGGAVVLWNATDGDGTVGCDNPTRRLYV